MPQKREKRGAKDRKGTSAGGRFAPEERAVDLPDVLLPHSAGLLTSKTKMGNQASLPRSVTGPWLPHENPFNNKVVLIREARTGLTEPVRQKQMLGFGAVLMSVWKPQRRRLRPSPGTHASLAESTYAFGISHECARFMPADYFVDSIPHEERKSADEQMIAWLAEHQHQSIDGNSPDSQLRFKPPTVITDERFKQMTTQAYKSQQIRWSAAVQLVANFNYTYKVNSIERHSYKRKTIEGENCPLKIKRRKAQALARRFDSLPDDCALSPIQGIPFVLYGSLSSMTQKEAGQLVRKHGGTFRLNNWQETEEHFIQPGSWEVSIIGMFPPLHKEAEEFFMDPSRENFDGTQPCITEADFLEMMNYLARGSL